MLPKKLFCPKCLLHERDQAFNDDLTNFYSYIKENVNSKNQYLSYSDYKKLYKDKKISMLHFAKRKEENEKEYYEVLFGEIQNFFFKEDNILTKLFSIYTLYSIYYTQTQNIFYQINTNLEFLKGVNSLIKKLLKEKNLIIAQIIYTMVQKLKNDNAFSIGVIPGLKSIILNKYGIPIEKKENVYQYTKDINNYMNLKTSEKKANLNENNNSLIFDYEKLKKNIVNDIKDIDINIDKDDYINFVNNNYNGNYSSNNCNYIDNNNILKKDDLKQEEITQLDFLFNQFI